MKLKGRKVIIRSGKDEGVEGYVLYECQDAVAIQAPCFFGADGWYGIYYARKDIVEVTDGNHN